MPSLTYIGAIKPPTPADRFVSSLFEDGEGHYFMQEEENERISAFVPVKVAASAVIIRGKLPVAVAENDPVVFSFIRSDNTLLYGRREQMEPLLAPLLELVVLNVYAKLLLSRFLGLYCRTVELIEASNIDMEANGVPGRIDEDLVFRGYDETPDVSPAAVDAVHERFNTLWRYNHRIRIEDVAIINSRHIYLPSYKVDLEVFMKTRNEGGDGRKDRLMEALLSASLSLNTLSLELIAGWLIETYRFMLTSNFVFAAPHAPDMERINIMDKEIYGDIAEAPGIGEAVTGLADDDLMESFNRIVQQMENT